MSGLFGETNVIPATRMFGWSDAQEKVLKRLFAHYMVLRKENQFEAASEVESQPGRVAYIAHNWANDPEVRAEMDRIRLATGALAKVPTKEQFAAEIYEAGTTAKTMNDKLTAWKFFAEVIGYVDRGGRGVNVNIQNNLGQKTLMVPVAASDEEWERAATTHSLDLHARHGS